MSQRRKTADKKNEFKICKSYPSTFDSSHRKDDSHFRGKSVSYLSGDRENKQRKIRKPRESLISPSTVRKCTNSGNFRIKNIENADQHELKDRYQDLLKSREFIKEKSRCHKNVHHQKNERRSSECSSEYNCYSPTKVHRFLDNHFHSDNKKKSLGSVQRYTNCKHLNDNIKRNHTEDGKERKVGDLDFLNSGQKENIKDLVYSRDKERKDVEESNIEGSARTRGLYFRKEGKKVASVSENFKLNHDIEKIRSRSKSLSRTEDKSQSRSEIKKKNSTMKCSQLQIETFSDSLKPKPQKISKEGIKTEDRKAEKLSKYINISSSDSEHSSNSNKSLDVDLNSLEAHQKELGITEVTKESISVNFNLENDEKIGNIRKKEEVAEDDQIIDKSSEIKISKEFQKRKIQEKEKKVQSKQITQSRYKNNNDPKYKEKNVCCLIMYLIRKMIQSKRRDGRKNNYEYTDKKINILKNDSCIEIKHVNKIESSCESSGYDSLKNIQDQLSENPFSVTQNEGKSLNIPNYLEFGNARKFHSDIELPNSEKYCVYKVYKSCDGEILLKESQNQKFKGGEYVIGERILNRSEKLIEFPKRMDRNMLKKNIYQIYCIRDNETQTELNMPATSKQNITGKQRWFKKYNKKRYQSVRKKHWASLESSSNSSFSQESESSDFEPLNLSFGKKENVYPQPTKSLLSQLPKPPPHFIKKSTTVDTSELSLYAAIQNSKEKSKVSLKSSEKEKYINSHGKWKNNFDIERNNGFLPVSPPLMIPVSWLKLDNSELIVHKTDLEEIFRVKMENNSNLLQSTELQTEKNQKDADISPQDPGLNKKKKSKGKLMRMFSIKKKNTTEIILQNND